MQLTPEQVNELFDKFRVKETKSDRYYAKSETEFVMLLFRNMMSSTHLKREAFAVERSLFTLNEFATLIYEDVVYNDNLGLIVAGKKVADISTMMNDFADIVLNLGAHFKAQTETRVEDVEAKSVLIVIRDLVERESDFESHKDATAKALSKAIDNIGTRHPIDLTIAGGELEVTYKG